MLSFLAKFYFLTKRISSIGLLLQNYSSSLKFFHCPKLIKILNPKSIDLHILAINTRNTHRHRVVTISPIIYSGQGKFYQYYSSNRSVVNLTPPPRSCNVNFPLQFELLPWRINEETQILTPVELGALGSESPKIEIRFRFRVDLIFFPKIFTHVASTVMLRLPIGNSRHSLASTVTLRLPIGTPPRSLMALNFSNMAWILETSTSPLLPQLVHPLNSGGSDNIVTVPTSETRTSSLLPQFLCGKISNVYF